MTKKKTGRPTKFSEENQKIALAAYKYGATDAQVAEDIGVTITTIQNWKIAHPEFFDTLKTAKAIADAQVEQSLFKRAKGYIGVDKEFPPDVTACIFWLKNRNKQEWRDTINQEISGSLEMPDKLIDSPPPLTREEWLKEYSKQTIPPEELN